MKTGQTLLAVAVLLVASPAVASWQTWVGAGGGRGGVFQQQGGGLVATQLGFRSGLTSVTFAIALSMESALGEPVADVSLLYGRRINSGALIIDAMAGPSLLDGKAQGFGITMGLRVSWPAARVIGLGLMPIISLNGIESYGGIILQLELGKLW